MEEGTMQTLKVMDLDPAEKAEIVKLIDFAMENEAYLHIEVRKPEVIAHVAH